MIACRRKVGGEGCSGNGATAAIRSFIEVVLLWGHSLYEVENALTYFVKSFVFFISPERINAVRSAVESYFPHTDRRRRNPPRGNRKCVSWRNRSAGFIWKHYLIVFFALPLERGVLDGPDGTV